MNLPEFDDCGINLGRIPVVAWLGLKMNIDSVFDMINEYGVG